MSRKSVILLTGVMALTCASLSAQVIYAQSKSITLSSLNKSSDPERYVSFRILDSKGSLTYKHDFQDGPGTVNFNGSDSQYTVASIEMVRSEGVGFHCFHDGAIQPITVNNAHPNIYVKVTWDPSKPPMAQGYCEWGYKSAK